MNIRNYAVAVVFSLDKAADDSDILSVLAVQRTEAPASGAYAFPMVEIKGGEASLREAVAGNLREILGQEVGEDGLLSLGADSVMDGEDMLVCTSFATFIDQYAVPVKGGVWFNVNSNGTLSNRLAFNHNNIFAAAAKELLHSVVSPFGKMSLKDSARLKDLLSVTLTGEERGKWLDRLAEMGLLGATSSSDLSTEEMVNTLRDRKKHVFNFFHPDVAVDIIVLARSEDDELVVPLVKRSEGPGKGYWGLPGEYLTREDLLAAGWDGKDVDKNTFEYACYAEVLNIKKSATRLAARNCLREKTGIDLSEGCELIPLTLRDNPLRGSTDGSPVLAVTYLAIMDKTVPLSASVKSNVADQKWFPIKRVLYNENGIVKICREKTTDNAFRISEESDRLDLSFVRGKTVAFIRGENAVEVDYFQTDDSVESVEDTVAGTLFKERKDPFFCDHGIVLVEALEYIKEQSRFSMIIPDFFGDAVFRFDSFRSVIENILWPEEKVRQNLYDLVKEDAVYGFLRRHSSRQYTISRDRFKLFLKSRSSTM